MTSCRSRTAVRFAAALLSALIAIGGLGACVSRSADDVSTACNAAMARVAPEWADDMEPLGNMQATLTACTSKREWMAAADRHRHDPTDATDPRYRSARSPIIAGSDLPTEQLWRNFCRLRSNVNGATPACDE